jgi:hypothetical protein
MEKVELIIRNAVTGKTTKVRAAKQVGMHIYQISAQQFDRVRANLGHGRIETDSGRVDAYKRSGQLHAVIEPSDRF